MKTVNILKTCIIILLLFCPRLSPADDTELFTVNASVAQERPNVLIILDNTANWNQPFEFEKSALVSVVNGLTNQFNVGLMLFTETGSGNPNPDGAYVRFAIRQMTADVNGVTGNKTRLAALVNGLDVLNDKSNGGKAGMTMYEAWQYYAGLASYSGGPPGYNNGKVKSDNGSVYIGTNPISLGDSGAFVAGSGTYKSPKAYGCQNNFIIYISNGPVQDNEADTKDATDRLTALGGNTSDIAVSPNGSQSNVADEYARFFSISSSNGVANITTYTIDVLPGTTGQGPGWTALLKSMALQGKGKYFVGTDAVTLTKALTDIFHEVMAVNSVFSSSTLPVNVSVRGTYLNQVYMAVFRPDANNSPRWVGNLKQYKLGYLDTTDTTFLADKNGLAAENTLSGFITPLATSIWTTSSTFWNSSYYPETQGQSSTPTSDAPDGALVEKGGAAQHLRTNYTYASSQPVRNLYTCNDTCNSGSSLSSFLFTGTNNNISLSELGLAANSIQITSLVRSTNTAVTATVTVTATTASNHGYTNGKSITISGANQAQYNGTFSITVTSPTQFTYTITETPATPATVASGKTFIVATQPNADSNLHEVATITHNGSVPNATATVTMPDDSWFRAYCSGTFSSCGGSAPTSVEITGASPSQYNGTKTATWLSSTRFTFPITTQSVAESPSAPTSVGTSAPGTPIAGCATSYTNRSMVRNGNTVTVTLPHNGNNPTTPEKCFIAQNTATIAGAVPTAYNGTWTITSMLREQGNGNDNNYYANSYTFNITVTPAGTDPVATATRTLSTVPIKAANTNYVSNVNVSAYTGPGTGLTRIDGTATVTTTSNHGFNDRSTVCIVNAAQSEYNVCDSNIHWVSSTKFTYSVAYSPITPATGSIVATDPSVSSLTKTDLINWVRGQNNQQNDNPTGSTTAVRGYIHGDVLHSRPSVVNYNRSGQPDGRDIVAYYGSNDGIFHAVKGGDNDADGNEKWGFVPVEHFGNFKRMYTLDPLISNAANNPVPKPYFVDGSVGNYTYDGNNDGRLTADVGSTDKVYLFLSMRRGGRFYYALDVTDPDAPKFLWKKSNTSSGYTELGQTWSEAKSAKIRYQTNPVLIFGLGYDAPANDANPPTTATMGRGIMVADAATGSAIWQAGPNPTGAHDNLTVSGMIYSISADPVVLDTNNDGYVDRIYVADTGGNVWRANIHDSDPEHWTVYKVASIGGTVANNRKFLYPPDVVYATGYDAILIGSGDREHPTNVTALNRYYMFKDSHSLNASGPIFPNGGNTYSYITEVDLYDATANLVQVGTSIQKTTAASSLTSKSGWYVTLGKYNSSTGAYDAIGEKVVGGSVSVGGATYFATNTPQISLGSTNACSSNLGESRLYALAFQTGGAVLDLDKTVTSSGTVSTSTTGSTTLTTSDRFQIQPGGGYAPSPVAAVVVLNGAPREAVIIGTSVMQTPRQDLNRRHSIYWGKKID